MKSRILSNLALANKHFKSLPDDRRVFFVDFPLAGYYLIPDPAVETRLFQITLWANIFLCISVFVIFGGLIFLRDSARYTTSLFWLIFLPLAAITRWVLYRNELRNLQKIDLSSAISTAYQKLSEDLRTHSNSVLPNYEIGMLLSIPNSSEKIVLLRYMEPFANILRCRLDGSIVWQAELPTTSNDVYTNVEWKQGKLYAFSRSCASVVINENTGRILSGR
jgi:hypothetical protein